MATGLPRKRSTTWGGIIWLQSICPTTDSRSVRTTSRPSAHVADISVRTSVGTAVPPGSRLISPIENPPPLGPLLRVALVAPVAPAATGDLLLPPEVHGIAMTATAPIAARGIRPAWLASFTSLRFPHAGDRSPA